MTANELRKKYLEFFRTRGHAIIPSASLIPENDPTVLFTTAGMHPLVPYLLGQPHPEGRRLTDVQKCVRTGDIDEVGDATHLTFFEMLGNWSLQDYFKKDAIAWSFEFLTKELAITLENLAISVFAGEGEIARDDESAALWMSHGIPMERIAFLGREDNWWGPAGKTGPCGPDTEMFYWTGSDEAPNAFDPKDKRWVEIWNDVFMQYNKTNDGTYAPLPAPNVDTGMGLERTLMVLTSKTSVYGTELFAKILRAIELTIQRSYEDHERSMRIVADHLRAAVFIVADGVEPSNKDQGYVLRRLIRRSVRELSRLSSKDISTTPIVMAVIETMQDAYPALREKSSRLVEVIQNEHDKFKKTLQNGLSEFEHLMKIKKSVSGEDAFNLYQSYGFPWELTEELVRERGQQVDRSIFESEFKKHQDLSRAGAQQKFAGGLADHSEEVVRLHTATHLVHQALRQVLGMHVLQRGSNITKDRLRFDFSHPEKMTAEQIAKTEVIVNEQIDRDLPVSFEILDVDEAKQRGAIGVFDDKYAQLGNKVKVYTVGDFSQEVCGGPHVSHTGELGAFKIQKEESVASGIRRIKAIIFPPK